MCKIFIKHVLGVESTHPGIYGDTAAYYGTVEQQGRLTLHLHLLLWIKGALSPQEIRDKIMDPMSDFQKKMVEYLESVHIGEFMTGSMSEIEAEIKNKHLNDKHYVDPTQTLPQAPPPLCDTCDTPNDKCATCASLKTWWECYKHEVDDLIFRSNVHNCNRNKSTSEKANKKDRPTCINQHGNCKARFPRPTYEQTEVDPKTGSLNIRKQEAWINTVTPVLTYLLRCNTDVTSLLSGTAIKAIVAYISDYVTKPGLKTYSIFDTVRSVFKRNSEMLGGSMMRQEKARRLIIKIVNALTAKMEIGGPMACLYLLGNPDHYTNYTFITVYWKSYVKEVANAWSTSNDMEVDGIDEKLILTKTKDTYVGYSVVHDYIYRPMIHSDKTLYEWVQMAQKVKIPKKEKNAAPNQNIKDDTLDTCDIDNSKFTSSDNKNKRQKDMIEIKESPFHSNRRFLRDHP